MQIFLDRFAATAGMDEHVALILGQAGWHGANSLSMPANITRCAVADLLARAQSGRAALALFERALPISPSAQRLRRHRRSRDARLESRPRRHRQTNLALLVSLDCTGESLGVLVSQVQDQKFVAGRPFSPHIRYLKLEKSDRKDQKTIKKERPIMYATHRDGCILTWWASRFKAKLEIQPSLASAKRSRGGAA